MKNELTIEPTMIDFRLAFRLERHDWIVLGLAEIAHVFPTPRGWFVVVEHDAAFEGIYWPREDGDVPWISNRGYSCAAACLRDVLINVEGLPQDEVLDRAMRDLRYELTDVVLKQQACWRLRLFVERDHPTAPAQSVEAWKDVTANYASLGIRFDRVAPDTVLLLEVAFLDIDVSESAIGEMDYVRRAAHKWFEDFKSSAVAVGAEALNDFPEPCDSAVIV